MRAARDFDVRAHLYAYWLRPESALWDAIAAERLGPLLRGKKDIVELGIGNGNFTFLMLGGTFSPQFDWFLNTPESGMGGHSDIYDFDAGIAMNEFIASRPGTRIRLGVDHKNLLSQAARLGFVDELVEHDCNLPLPMGECATVYSNILYWLKDPLRVVDNIGANLSPGAELIAVFPNGDFYRNCESYVRDEPLWKLLNRGRASHIMWHMDLAEFEHEIKRRKIFVVQHAERYLAPAILRIWDIGLRPLTVPLIKMANSMSPEKRLEIKQEWCETLEKFAEPLLNMELEMGQRTGGFNMVRLVRK